VKALVTAACFAFLAFTFTGCASRQEVRTANPTPEQLAQASPAEKTKADKLNDLLIKSLVSSNINTDADYIIGSEDTLEIEVFQVEELKKTVRVSAQGYIGLPLIGRVKAKGLTAIQLEKEIGAMLEEKYLQQPTVTVHVKDYNSQKIAVLGAVGRPQIYPVTGPKYLLDMIVMAGGLAQGAGTMCYIIRAAGPEETDRSKNQTIVIDLGDMLEKGNLALNIPVFGGDVINIPKGATVLVGGAVNRKGAIQMQGKVTLSRVIIMADGLRADASSSDIKVYREKGDGNRDIITVDLDAILEGKEKDFELKENDVVVAQRSPLKGFISDVSTIVRGSMSFGSVGVSY
jgi:polysaccharide export outer membrane protein